MKRKVLTVEVGVDLAGDLFWEAKRHSIQRLEVLAAGGLLQSLGFQIAVSTMQARPPIEPPKEN